MTGSSADPPGTRDLGLATSEVRLAPYDPDWAVLGVQECATVRALLGDTAIEVLHVGSTAVPGIAAKPILDIVAAVGDDVPIDEVVGRLCATGAYGYEGDQGDDGGAPAGARHGRAAHGARPRRRDGQPGVGRLPALPLASGQRRRGAPALRVGQASAGAAVSPRPPGVHPSQGRRDPRVVGRLRAVARGQTG